MITINKFCKCLEPWQGCLLAGIYSVMTSIFDLLWSIALMLNEKHPLIFFLLFFLSIESTIFLVGSCLLFVGLLKAAKWFLVPWMVIALLDVTLGLTIPLVELSIPNRNIGTPCIVSVAGFFISFAVAAVMVYCFLAVYTHHQNLSKASTNVTKIRITPASDDENIVQEPVIKAKKSEGRLDVISVKSYDQDMT